MDRDIINKVHIYITKFNSVLKFMLKTKEIILFQK